MVFVGTWLSGYFIVTTNAFMQHPVGHEVLADGSIALKDLGAYLTNSWAWVQYAHTMVGSVVTAATFMAARPSAPTIGCTTSTSSTPTAS